MKCRMRRIALEKCGISDRRQWDTTRGCIRRWRRRDIKVSRGRVAFWFFGRLRFLGFFEGFALAAIVAGAFYWIFG